jgi:hypothetical protein
VQRQGDRQGHSRGQAAGAELKDRARDWVPLEGTFHCYPQRYPNPENSH